MKPIFTKLPAYPVPQTRDSAYKLHDLTTQRGKAGDRMTLKSMTGFARADGVHGDTSWHWEARSVNGRNLDLRLRLPSGFEGLEIRARGLAQEKLARGNCTINLWVKRESGQMEIRLNEAALGQARAVAARAHDLTGLKPPRLDTLLGMRGVVETVEGEESEEAQAALYHALLASLASALDQLVAARASEGARLQTVIEKQLAVMTMLVERAAGAAARQPEALAVATARPDRPSRRGGGSASIRSACIKKHCCWRPRPISKRSSIACARMSRRRAS